MIEKIHFSLTSKSYSLILSILLLRGSGVVGWVKRELAACDEKLKMAVCGVEREMAVCGVEWEMAVCGVKWKTAVREVKMIIIVCVVKYYMVVWLVKKEMRVRCEKIVKDDDVGIVHMTKVSTK